MDAPLNYYGLLHLEVGRGEQIYDAEFDSVGEFFETIVRGHATIREVTVVESNQTYLLEINEEHKHNYTLFVRLSRNGSYWSVKSAGIFKEKYSRCKTIVFTRPALGPETNTDPSGVDSGRENCVTAPAGNSPQTSSGKDDTNSLPHQRNCNNRANNSDKGAETAGNGEGAKF